MARATVGSAATASKQRATFGHSARRRRRRGCQQPVTLAEIEADGRGLGQDLPLRRFQRRDEALGVDRQIGGLAVLALADLDRDFFVGQRGQLEHELRRALPSAGTNRACTSSGLPLRRMFARRIGAVSVPV